MTSTQAYSGDRAGLDSKYTVVAEYHVGTEQFLVTWTSSPETPDRPWAFWFSATPEHSFTYWQCALTRKALKMQDILQISSKRQDGERINTLLDAPFRPEGPIPAGEIIGEKPIGRCIIDHPDDISTLTLAAEVDDDDNILGYTIIVLGPGQNGEGHWRIDTNLEAATAYWHGCCVGTVLKHPGSFITEAWCAGRTDLENKLIAEYGEKPKPAHKNLGMFA